MESWEKEKGPSYHHFYRVVSLPNARESPHPKYFDPRILLVDVHINKSLIQHTLINLGVTINVMTRDTLLILNLQPFLRNTATILQLVDSSIVCPEGILEENNVSIGSW